MKSRALAFARVWTGVQREKSEAQTFLNEFFQIFGRDRRAVDAKFEHAVVREDRGEGSIDLFWPSKLVIEMKSTGKDLSSEKGGAAKQAFDYLDHLEPEERPRWVLVSDFAHFVLYDLGEEVHDYLKGLAYARKTKPVIAAQFTLDELPNRLRFFAFIRDEEQALFQTQPEVNLKAVSLLGDLHDELKKSGYAGHRLERFLVRVLFCLFAEDTDIFEWESFTRFVRRSKKDGSDLGQRLAKLFEVLDQDANGRSTNLATEFTFFPYVNGGLFAERLDIADMSEEHRAALLKCCTFDWSKISPGVFGSLFQGVMDKKERRAKGAHYTSEENIRRVIDPLFLDALKAEFAQLSVGIGKRLEAIRTADAAPVSLRGRKASPSAYDAFHDKLASLRFFDPACGCGNFLVVAYRELRALELELLGAQYGKQLPLGLDVGDLARINVDQFYGIELEEFPALIAETALWLTDHQVNMAFSKAFGKHFARIPLKKSPTIKPGNALRTDWRTVLPAEKCSYILGNPPFIGKKEQSAEQKIDMKNVWGDAKGTGVLDYVTCWYRQAAEYIQDTAIRCAFVSTNSITQGEQVGVLWSQLAKRHIKIHFAHRTFVWHNEASGKAHVHVVIIGFGAFETTRKTLFDYDSTGKQSVSSGTLSLSPYLIAGNSTVILARSAPVCAVPPMIFGTKLVDDGHFVLTPDERTQLLQECPEATSFIRPFIGGEELLNGSTRFVLWLERAPLSLIRNCIPIRERVERVRAFRAASKKGPTVELAATPSTPGEDRQPKSNYLLFPKVSSERRSYIPLGFISSEYIANGSALVVPDATGYHFGILSSAMHNAWMRTVAGRLESRYQYSNTIVYNNYPWPEPDKKGRISIEVAAQTVIDSRAPRLAAGASLADLYDPLSMPAELLKAHRILDHAVDKAYRPAPFASDRERVEYLFARYEQLVAPLAPAARPKRKVNLGD